MKINFTAITGIMFFSFCLSAVAFGQQARLEGIVYEIANDREVSVAGVRVIALGGQSQETDSKGHFVIYVPNSVQAGQATRIEVNRPGWLVRDPFFGECATQNAARNFESLKVTIVPKGSPLALEPKQLSKVVARWANERVRLRGQVTELGLQLDEYAFLREYAEKYGFTLEQFRDAADQWANSKEASDNLEAGWKEYWKKNYGLAAQLGASSKNAYKEKLRRDKQDRLEDGRKFIRSVHLEGNARYAEYDFRAAMTAYQEIETAFNDRELVRDDFLLEWADTKKLLGNAKQQLGIRVEGRESQSLLGEAVAAFHEALKVFTRDQSPQDWAGTQNNLGITLGSHGELTEGAEGARLLGEAGAAYREALKVRTREQSPQDWAMTQNNLGITLMSQGKRAEGAEGARLLGEAVAAYREALKVRTREQSPQDWAMTQNNLGIALRSQGERAEGAEGVRLLGEAVAAYREALKVYTREHSPPRWTMTQNNLGVALYSQGERAEGAGGVKLLGEAVAAFREAMEVRTREQSPQQWAMTQNNLGAALMSQGGRAEGAEGARLLGEAVAAYREALKVHTREQSPQDWAKTQNNLGVALRSQGEWAEGAGGVRLLGEAVAAYREALKVYTREQSPQDWAMTQNNLGNSLRSQGEGAEGAEGVRLLGEAVAIHREALRVYTREHLPQDWAITQNHLGNALMSQGERAEGAEGERLLGEAVAAHREALKIRTREHLPQDWAITQNNLAKAYFLLRNRLGAAESYANVFTLYPNYEEAYTGASALYHDVLFNFEKAFSLNQQWLARRPDDLSAQVDFAEKHFTTARFEECERRINALLAKPEASASTKSALRVIEMASLLALDQVDRISPKVEALIAEVSRQPAEFKVGWVFDGTRRFISQTEKLSPYRDWLDKLFDAIGGKDRETILKGLKEAKESFKTR